VKMDTVDDLQQSDKRNDNDDVSILTYWSSVAQSIALLIYGPCLRDYTSRNIRQIHGAVIFLEVKRTQLL
jgi:hypothetical protein